MKPLLPFRLGSTSYVYPADILPNVRRLAPIVDDVELVLFEVDEGNNLPSASAVAELSGIAMDNNLSYTVHLPLDLRLAASDLRCRHDSIDKARRTIAATRGLEPWAYVVHLDGADLGDGADEDLLSSWRERAAESVWLVGAEAGDIRLLALENLESYHPKAFLPVAAELGASLCIDVGHFVKAGLKGTELLDSHLDRTRVVHLHGLQGGRDHKGLDQLPDGLLSRVVERLLTHDYHGVVTIEVFSEDSFFPSRELLVAMAEEYA